MPAAVRAHTIPIGLAEVAASAVRTVGPAGERHCVTKGMSLKQWSMLIVRGKGSSSRSLHFVSGAFQLHHRLCSYASWTQFSHHAPSEQTRRTRANFSGLIWCGI